MRAHVDAQATKGVSHRSGLGKARDIETAELWIQDALARQEFDLVKVGGERNPADILAKPVPQEMLERHLASLGCWAVPATASP